jgi:tetratricopeptide (TPR) repeat protein
MNGPSGNDYFSAAMYYFQEGMDLNKAKEWIDKAVSMNDKAFWVMRQQSLIYAKMGDKEGAIMAAKKSLEVAEAAGNQDYIKMNKDSLKEWGAM